ncbi:UNVERIFIED_CONTAM: hypothetical protein HDU68_011016 [Siphonaria sp. JEL0065]|nr:hypothetical protein HDU68_011016 [Siphonaria sp. JEL0065]
MNALEQIYMDGCAMTGSLPEIFNELPNLIVMDLNRNQFTGLMPSTFSYLSNLRWLQLQHNKFSGSVPFGLSDYISQLECTEDRHCFL